MYRFKIKRYKLKCIFFSFEFLLQYLYLLPEIKKKSYYKWVLYFFPVIEDSFFKKLPINSS